MSTAAALLARLGTLGISAEADCGALRLRPASAIPADLLDDLRQHKAEVLALLAVSDDPGRLLNDDETDAPHLRAEPALPPPGTPERDMLDTRQRETVAGLLAAAP